YLIQSKLGEGGMGAVYRAFDRLIGQTVALKQVLVDGDQLQFASQSTDQDIRLSLALEFRTLAGLRHPHIVSVLDYGFDRQRQPFFTMQLIEGAKTLTEYASTNELDTAGKVRILIEILQALAYLHRRGIIHRDLKPANVLVTPEGVVKVLDFGLALHQSDSVTSASTGGVGTLAYMAPELFADEPATVESDLYAVGVIAYEVFVGKYPFNLKNMSLLVNGILHEKPDTTMLDFDLAEVLDRLLAKSMADRYHQADGVIDALCTATGQPIPPENAALRDSFLQAAKFVGRTAELDQLLESLQEALQSQGATWLIGGESGVGKSRLLDELRSRSLVDGAVVVRGQAVEGGGLPYQLWRDPLRRLVLAVELSDLEAGILKPLIPDLDDLLERGIVDAPDLPGEAGQRRLTFTIAEVFKRQPAPVLLLLEDLQWSGESLRPLQHLNELVSSLPLLIVGTYRDDEMPNLPGELPGMTPLRLMRLSDHEIAELSESMLGDAGKQEPILNLLKHQTEGNTFFMVETVRALAESAGRLDDIAMMTLPETVISGGMQQIIRRRLNRVPETMNELLKLAAVGGRQIDLKVLEQIQGAGLDDFVTVCSGAAVLEIVDDHWRFTHDKLREAVLDDLPPDERAGLHGRVAEGIEQVYPDNNAYADILLEHWRHTDKVEKTLHYTLLFSDRLIGYTADALAARQLVEQGLALVDRLPELRRNYFRARLLRLKGKGWELAGNFPLAIDCFHESLQLSQDDPTNLMLAEGDLGWAAVTTGNYQQAQEHEYRLVKLAEELNDQRSLAYGLYVLGIVDRVQADFTGAKAYFERSLKIRQAIHDQRGIGHCFASLGFAAILMGDHASGRTYLEQSLSIAREIGDQNAEAVSLNNLGEMAFQRGDYEAARSYYQQTLAIHSRHGNQSGVAVNLNNLGGVLLALSEIPAAEAHLLRGLQISAESKEVPLIIELVVNLAHLALLKGNAETGARWTGLALSHPSILTETLEHVAKPLQAKLEAALGAAKVAELMEAGKNLNLDTVVQQILTEYRE
ncbi:MAG TPA: tetratricopeptide repeat protein, partial [Phototrophicaceae bacterium]|nr:tetratricopeptide repeat protein [Phototrophicaceae bacterium]